MPGLSLASRNAPGAIVLAMAALSGPAAFAQQPGLGPVKFNSHCPTFVPPEFNLPLKSEIRGHIAEMRFAYHHPFLTAAEKFGLLATSVNCATKKIRDGTITDPKELTAFGSFLCSECFMDSRHLTLAFENGGQHFSVATLEGLHAVVKEFRNQNSRPPILDSVKQTIYRYRCQLFDEKVRTKVAEIFSNLYIDTTNASSLAASVRAVDFSEPITNVAALHCKKPLLAICKDEFNRRVDREMAPERTSRIRAHIETLFILCSKVQSNGCEKTDGPALDTLRKDLLALYEDEALTFALHIMNRASTCEQRKAAGEAIALGLMLGDKDGTRFCKTAGELGFGVEFAKMNVPDYRGPETKEYPKASAFLLNYCRVFFVLEPKALEELQLSDQRRIRSETAAIWHQDVAVVLNALNALPPLDYFATRQILEHYCESALHSEAFRKTKVEEPRVYGEIVSLLVTATVAANRTFSLEEALTLLAARYDKLMLNKKDGLLVKGATEEEAARIRKEFLLGFLAVGTTKYHDRVLKKLAFTDDELSTARAAVRIEQESFKKTLKDGTARPAFTVK